MRKRARGRPQLKSGEKQKTVRASGRLCQVWAPSPSLGCQSFTTHDTAQPATGGHRRPHAPCHHNDRVVEFGMNCPSSFPRRPPWSVALALALCALTQSAWAQNATCDAQASEKKLAGAAKTSFVKKCEAEGRGAAAIQAAPAQAECEAKAAGKKLAGAAKNSFVKKCVKDAGAEGAASAPATQ